MKARCLLITRCLALATIALLNTSLRAQEHLLPEVWIEATVPETLEPAPNTRVSPGEFTMTRLGDTNEALLLFVEFSGTATLGQDYQETSPYLVMPAGATKLTIPVAPLDDSIVEGDETVIATLSTNPPINSLPNYTVHARLHQATVVIHDNDFPPDLPVVSIRGLEAVLELCPPNADCAGIQFYLRRAGPGLDRPLTVFLRYGGTAMAEADYRALPSQVTFEAGRDLVTVFSVPIDDTLFEGDETVVAGIGAGSDYYTDPNWRQATTVILDNDPPEPPVVSLELLEREATETRIDQNAIFWAEFRVLRTGPATNELVAFLDTREGTARFGEDYWLEHVNEGSTVRFLPGERAVNVRLFPIDDELYEGDETVFIHLIAPPYASPLPDPYRIDPAHSSIEIVIHDNDPVTTRLEITSPTDGQHFQAGGVIQLRSQIIGPDSSNELWIVEFLDGEHPIGTTRPGGAIWWQDAIGGPHIINARAVDPGGIPGHDTLVARPVTISVGPGPALPVVSITASRWKTGEPCPVCLVAPGVFTISRTGPTNEALAVYLEYDGPATPGQDYQELPHQITIPPGTNSAEVLVLALDDRLVEGPEILRASIALPEFAARGYIASFYASQAMVVIADDEAGAPEIRLDIAEPDEGAQFAAGAPIEISALAVWIQGEVDRPVRFFAGDRFIGQSEPPLSLRPVVPGLPSVHTVFWTNPPPGRHVLTARYDALPDLKVSSPPVNIAVGTQPTHTVVSIVATERIAEEDSNPFDRVPLTGLFTISRTGPINASLPVYVQYSGSATAGEDYPVLPWVVSIPPGAASTVIRVVPMTDPDPEGLETVVATISNCPPPWLRTPCYDFEIDPVHESATVFIRDDGRTRASLVIDRPKDGANFTVGQTIPVEATAIDLDGYISHVEFFDGDQRIGESQIDFIRAPDPGTPIQHSFEWHGAALGSHELSARAAATSDAVISSLPVQITVGPTSNQPPRVVITRPVAGAEFPLNLPIEIAADARDPDGYVRKAEFFADGRKIGESGIEFLLPPPPGQTQAFTFVWRFPEPGPHTLSVRATDDGGADGSSAPVEIRVSPQDLLPVVTVRARDTFAVEPGSNTVLNAASFRIRRFGPTNDQLAVNYSLHGTAKNGVDYEMLSGLAILNPGERTVLVPVRPLPDTLAEGVETVILRLEEPPPVEGTPEVRLPRYRLGFPSRAVTLISDHPWIHLPGAARCVLLPDAMWHVCFGAEAGYSFRIEASRDLRNWETICGVLSASGAVHHVDDEAQNFPRRFYRLSPEPVIDAEH